MTELDRLGNNSEVNRSGGQKTSVNYRASGNRKQHLARELASARFAAPPTEKND